MSQLKSKSGICLCGEVKIEANSIKTDVSVCHCDMCRKWGGGPLVAYDCCNDKQVTFNGSNAIAVYSSSMWAERGFCNHCGTHLFYRTKQTQNYYIPVELFSDTSDTKIAEEIYYEKKPAYYKFCGNTQKITGEEIMNRWK